MVAVTDRIFSHRVPLAASSELVVIHLSISPDTYMYIHACYAYVPSSSPQSSYDNIFTSLQSIPTNSNLYFWVTSI